MLNYERDPKTNTLTITYQSRTTRKLTQLENVKLPSPDIEGEELHEFVLRQLFLARAMNYGQVLAFMRHYKSPTDPEHYKKMARKRWSLTKGDEDDTV
jgi:hypothetical protein